MKSVLLAMTIVFGTFYLNAQTVTPTVVPAPASQESDLTGQDLIRKYKTYEGAVLNMTREEWEVFLAWEGYDRRAHVEIIEAYKAPFQADREARKAARIARADDCDCWVEPDNTYTQVTTDDWTGQGGAGLDVDCYIGPISTGWDFDLYGALFNEFWINSKGTVSFGDGYINWTPQEFPGATYDQIAGFWADSDFRGTGELWYKVTPEAVYVNFVDLGYFNNKSDRMNNFQIIFTPSEDGLLGAEHNVQLCYLDMQWAHGDVGGSGGFNGPNPANVGCDRASTTGSHIQYGRFNLNSAVYNGPYGIAPNQQDGIDWLDFKVFNINTIGSASSNIPPIPTQSFGCDDVTICINDTLDIDIQFLAPENNQTVTIDVSVDGNEAGLFIDELTTANIASIVGGFVGSAATVGTHTITITATDDGSPAATTVVEVTVEVVPVELPSLTVSGNFAVCAGSTTEITASPGFDSYSWSTGCETQSCEIFGGGSFQVTGFFDACSSTQTFNIETTPYFLPCINIEPNPVCSNDTATVSVCENAALDSYVGFQWDANWNGLGGTIYGEDESVVQVSPGTYRLLVENDEGCFGQRVFIVEGIDAFIPNDVWSGAYCDGLEDVTFSGGFSNPAQGNLTMYLTSSDNGGWNGSFVNVIINGEVVDVITTTTNFVVIQQAIASGDVIELEYVSSGVGDDDNYGIQIFNCVNTNATTIAGLSDGIVFSADAGCSSQPAFGEWEIVSGPEGGEFTVEDQFNTTFSPADFGLYEICFFEATCGIPYCYELEYTEAPTIALNETDVLLCGDDSVTLEATITDIGGTATIEWPEPGVNDELSNTYSYNEPQEITLTVTITNGCGTDEAEVEVVVQSEPTDVELEDAVLCEGGDLELVPIENPGDDLIFEWTYNGTVVSDDFELIATETGEYCVTVSNQCFPEGVSSCAELAFAGEIPSPTPGFATECDGGTSVTINANFPAPGWSIEWPDGSTGNSFVATENGTVTVLVTDPGDCETTEYNTTVFIGSAPTANPSPTELITLCPEVNNTFSLNATSGVNYNWSINCDAGVDLVGDSDLILNSASISPDCWGSELTLTGEVSNPCGTATGEYAVLIDPCEITIPNIFTPNNDGINDRYFIDGLDVYRNVFFRVYNRWGDTIYESDNYINGSWRGDDAVDGTYWYVIRLPNGREYTGTLNISGTEIYNRRR